MQPTVVPALSVKVRVGDAIAVYGYRMPGSCRRRETSQGRPAGADNSLAAR